MEKVAHIYRGRRVAPLDPNDDERMPHGITWWFWMLSSKGHRVMIPRIQSNISPLTGQKFDRFCPYEELGYKYWNTTVGKTKIVQRSPFVKRHVYDRHMQDYAIYDQPLEEIAAQIEERMRAYIAHDKNAVGDNLQHAVRVFVVQWAERRGIDLNIDDPRVMRLVDKVWPDTYAALLQAFNKEFGK